jgi:hypothetical protein
MEFDRVRQIVTRLLPYGPDRVLITSAAPVDIGADPNSPDVSNEVFPLSHVAIRAEQLRQSQAIVVGILPFEVRAPGGGLLALTYGLPDHHAVLPYVIGWFDLPADWFRGDAFGEKFYTNEWVLVHELGHVDGLIHTRCGPGAVGNYPFDHSRLGRRPMYASDYRGLQFGQSMAPWSDSLWDIMIEGCGGRWISDYHYLIAQRTAEQREKARTTKMATMASHSPGSAAKPPILLVGGITSGQARVAWTRAKASYASTGLARTHARYDLTLEFDDGSVMSLPLSVAMTGNVAAQGVFEASLHHPGTIVRAHVARDGRPIPTNLKQMSIANN